MAQIRVQVSDALRQRDQSGIGIKWPLPKVTIPDSKYTDEYLEIIKLELNVKKIELTKGENKEVKLDTTLTPELEAEGYAREITRKVQAARKTAGFLKAESIELEITSDFNKEIESFDKFIKERVGAKKLFFKKVDKKYAQTEEGSIKGKKYQIRFSKA